MGIKKTITYKGIEYVYEIVRGILDFRTYVYDSTPIVTYVKKYWLFGPLVKKVSYRYLFQIWHNIESASYSKKEVEEIFEKEVEWLNRKKEIENGEIL